jgi:DNA-directed RNA polymerase specialized sigma subunit
MTKNKHLENYEIFKKFAETENSAEKQIILNQIMILYQPLLIHLAKKIIEKHNMKYTYEEITGYAQKALKNKILSYDLSKNIQFKTHAYRRLWGAMLDGLYQDKILYRYTKKHISIEYNNDIEKTVNDTGLKIIDDQDYENYIKSHLNSRLKQIHNEVSSNLEKQILHCVLHNIPIDQYMSETYIKPDRKQIKIAYDNIMSILNEMNVNDIGDNDA